MFTKNLLPVIAISSLAFLSATTYAQPASSPAPISSQTQTDTPTDIQLDQFVSAALEIEKVKAELQQFLAEKPKAEVTDQLIDQVNTQFNQEAIKAIEKSGLSVERYSKMMALMDQDSHFLQRVQQKIEEKK
jgi:pantothenate kinase type III